MIKMKTTRKMEIPNISSIDERIMQSMVVKDMGIIPGSYEEGIRNCYDSNISEMRCPNQITTRIPMAPLKGDAYLLENAGIEVELKIKPENLTLTSVKIGPANNAAFTDVLIGYETAGMVIDDCMKLLLDNSEVYTLPAGAAATISKLIFASLSAETTRNSLTAINIEDIAAGKPLPPCMKRFTMQRVTGDGVWKNVNPKGVTAIAAGESFTAEDLTWRFRIDLSQWLPIFNTLPIITKSIGNLTLELNIRNPLSTMVWAYINDVDKVINFLPLDKPAYVAYNEVVANSNAKVYTSMDTSNIIGFQKRTNADNATNLLPALGTAKAVHLWNISEADAWQFTQFRLLQTCFQLKNPQGVESMLQRGLRIPMTHITDHTFNNNTNYGAAGSTATMETKINAYAVKALVMTFPYYRELRHWLPNLEFKNLRAQYGGQSINQEEYLSINDHRAVNHFLNAFTNTDTHEPNPNYRLTFNQNIHTDADNLFDADKILGAKTIAGMQPILNRQSKIFMPNCTFIPIDFSMLGDFRGGLNSNNFIATDFRVNFQTAVNERFGGSNPGDPINTWLSRVTYGNINDVRCTPIIYALEHVFINFVWENGALRRIMLEKSAPQTQ